MEYTNAAWLQTQIADLQTVHDERTSATPDDWKEQAASVQGGINDLLGDIQVSNTSTASTNSPGPTFFLPYPLQLLSTTSPFNSAPFGASQWQASSSQQVPVSSYSSLNGATAASSHLQSQGHSVGTMVIDPALTTMNGSSGSPPQQFQQPSFMSSQPQSRMQFSYQQQAHSSPLSINPSYVHANASHYQQPQQQHSISLSRNHSHSPSQQQQQQQQQGTLSPFVLHSPTSGFYAGIPPSSFYGQSLQPQAGPSSTPQPPPQPSQPAQPPPSSASPPAPNKPSPEQRRAKLAQDVKPFIQPTSFTGAGAVNQLVNILDDYGIPEVEASLRLEILTKIRDNAGNHYFRAWVDNTVALDIIREWLKLAFQGRNEPQLLETIMPILHIIDRLPLTVDKLKTAKLGKLIMRLVKEPPTPAIKDMAANLEKKWRKLLAQEVSDKMDTENPEDKNKKRRAEGIPAKGAPPVKKAAVPGATASTPKAIPVKKEAKPVVKDAKSDSSFFSKPKVTKKELPSFKKNAPAAPAPVKKESDQNIAQPSSFNPFEEVLKSYGSAGASATPPPSVPSPAPGPSTTVASVTAPSGLTRKGKLKRSVTWAPDGQLEQIRLIERAVYDDDPATGSHPAHNIRDLDRDEGAALHAVLFDEQIEWAEPQPLELPPEIQIPPRGNDSQERAAQEEREQNALLVLYPSPTQIPDSPAEPLTQIAEDHVDEGMVLMLTGPEVDAVLWNASPPPSTPSAVADLVAQLASGSGGDVLMGDSGQAAAAVSNMYTNGDGFDAEKLKHLMAQLQQSNPLATLSAGGLAPSQPQQGDSAQGWNPGNQYSDYDRGYHENGAGRGGGDPSRRWNDDGPWGSAPGGPGPAASERGFRGRGRGGPRGMGRGRGDGHRNTKRKPCSFFLAGRCRYGDQCDFSHEALPY
ncbi:hypothetical protein BD311DRAFT_788974 [Dichomitus squalens]|uniref:Serine/threonine-protein phosphatase 1 regulatory subunit 10 n=1 Tax=Dichomitus squalens TaxID=114155 RepID=A0A4Q9MNP6_9APHY|nr:hypothetical protein BD311DRAFT_788974 [Dichomitus squalens]